MPRKEFLNVVACNGVELDAGARARTCNTPQDIPQLLGQPVLVQRLALVQVLPDVSKNLACLLRNSRRRVEELLLVCQPRIHGPRGRLLVFVKRHGNIPMGWDKERSTDGRVGQDAGRDPGTEWGTILEGRREGRGRHRAPAVARVPI